MEPGRPGASGPDPFRILLGAMMAAARARSARSEHFDHDHPTRLRPRGGCCFGRLLVFALLLLAFAVLAPMVFGMFLGFY
jgi:hypothetical protein